ncbi:MAG: ribonuclease Z [Anaerolineales bacterium]|nr:ribonuclease Z [Anaerolineales bacterium]
MNRPTNGRSISKSGITLFELTFLGTSASAPSVHRGLSAQVVSFRDQRFLIDCGEGTQRQILRSGLGFRRLNRILITHGHLDHILGLAGLLSTFSRWEALEHLEVWAGAWAMERIRDLVFGVVLRGARPPLDISLQVIEPGVLFQEGDLTVSAFPVIHRGPGCFGFQFEESTRRPFLPEKANELGIPAGPVRRELVSGNSVTLPDGRVIEPGQVLGPERRGVKLVHIGDCGSTDNLYEFVEGADALVLEATYLSIEEELAAQFGHLTAAQAAGFAHEANVEQLFLTHISRRYREREILAEAQEIFPRTSVARDFDHHIIRRSEN